MRKILFLLAASILFLTACGNSEDGSKKDTSDVEEKNEESAKSEFNFDGKTAEIEMVKVEIKETKVIPVGEEGNEYGDKPVFAIWYDATNLSDEDIDPSTAWLAIFTAIQDNDPNMVNELEVGSLPDEAHLDTQLNTIKKDGTVENSIAYELDDLETPVTLVANQGLGGDEIGRHEFEIK